uniref:Retrovirus-related Pol polyprotein from transposon TNT 1-94 n=1 Tax=Chenopodium quinoa TaxID=63459 RepID=A0A803MQV9_CHEQI
GGKPILEGYTDADMTGDLDNRKSTSGYVMTGDLDNRKSTSEYIAAVEVGKEMLWLKRFLRELGLKEGYYVVLCDSQSDVDLSKNSTYHAHTKHIDVRYHWL